MERLIYYVMDAQGEMRPFLQYDAATLGIDELYARQLCTYFIYNGQQYELYSNELEGAVDLIVLKDNGRAEKGDDERDFRGESIMLEFRRPERGYRLMTRMPLATHYEAIRFLVKHVVEVPGAGSMLVTSSEVDEDRGVYVLYVKELT